MDRFIDFCHVVASIGVAIYYFVLAGISLAIAIFFFSLIWGVFALN
ncbi:hypothetical protein [Lactiplantibacillus paraxiangfangensis]